MKQGLNSWGISVNFETVLEAVKYAEAVFLEHDLYYGHGTDNVWDEACYLVLSVLGLSPDADESVGEMKMTPEANQKVSTLVQQRVQTRKPLPYLLGKAWFCGLPFHVNENVLIPRSPIAELIVERFEPWVDEKNVNDILDLCTGGGCIALALGKYFPQAEVVGSDISSEALEVADKNKSYHSVFSQNVTFIQSDLFASLQGRVFDLIVSNPPYVDEEEMAHLPAEYHHEPVLALASGFDGLNVVRRILRESSSFLKEDGVLICEVGASWQALEAAFPQVAFLWLDLACEAEGVFMLTKAQLEHLAAN